MLVVVQTGFALWRHPACTAWVGVCVRWACDMYAAAWRGACMQAWRSSLVVVWLLCLAACMLLLPAGSMDGTAAWQHAACMTRGGMAAGHGSA